MNTEGMRVLVNATSTSFVLADANLFSGTRYKVLKNQRAGYFVPCVKSFYNGKVKLTYLTSGYVSLKSRFYGDRRELIQPMLANLVKAVASVKDNGFLSVQDIVLDPAGIYTKTSDASIGLMYIPLTSAVSGATEVVACQNLYQLCMSAIVALMGNSEYVERLRETAAYESGDLDYLYKELSEGELRCFGGLVEDEVAPSQSDLRSSFPSDGLASELSPNSPPKSFLLTSEGLSPVVSFCMDKPRAVMGKHPRRADFIVQSSAVSRMHCELSIREHCLFVTDLRSVNGTFVDGRRIVPDEAVPLPEGSILRLANVDFRITRAE